MFGIGVVVGIAIGLGIGVLMLGWFLKSGVDEGFETDREEEYS